MGGAASQERPIAARAASRNGTGGQMGMERLRRALVGEAGTGDGGGGWVSTARVGHAVELVARRIAPAGLRGRTGDRRRRTAKEKEAEHADGIGELHVAVVVGVG